MFARCEALVETLALEMDFQKASEDPENPPGRNDMRVPNL
jgi:hypothetical protein